ncbi:MFS transporter [Geminicoccaceae bacterium 1502E]|nr:MFS transporter [Geminicoccaceae bacterium 1502E]
MRPADLRPVFRPLLVTLLIQALVSGAAFSVPVLAPALAAAFEVPASWSGYYVAVVYLGATLASAAAFPLLRRSGALGVTAMASLLTGLGLAALAPGLLVPAMAGALVAGLGYGLTNPAASEILARGTEPRIRAVVFSLKQTGVPLGGMLAGATVPRLLEAAGWQATLLIVAGICLLAAALLFAPGIRIANVRPQHEGNTGAVGALRLVLGSPGLRLLAFASFGLAAMQLCVTAALVAHLVETVGFSLLDAGLLFALAQGAGVLGRILWGVVADLIGSAQRTFTLLCVAITLCAWALALLDPGWPGWLVALVCIATGGTALAWNGVYIAEIVRLAPPHGAGAATGGALIFTYAGVVVGPPLFSVAADLAGTYAAAYGLVSLLTLGSVALTLRVNENGPARHRRS